MAAALFGLVLLSCFLRIVYCQSVLTTVVSKSPVYSGDPITLTCTLESDGAILFSVTIEAVNETQNVGTLFCLPATGSAFRNKGTGRFGGYRFTGCGDSSVNHQSISFNASPSWELDYRCTYMITITSNFTVQNVSSAFMHLSVWVLPEPPSISPTLMVFNEGENAVVSCNSRFGKPASAINLTVMQPFQSCCEHLSGTDSVSLTLPSPLSQWLGAAVACRVSNHNIPDATPRTITVNYIAARRDKPVELDSCTNDNILNCSAEISSFPGVSYNWSIPPEANSSESSSSLSSPVFAVPQGRTGLFECTAKNVVTLKTVRITFVVSCVADAMSWQAPAANNWIWAIVAVGAAAVIIIIVIIHLYRRGLLPKRFKSSCFMPASRRHTEGSNHRGRLLIAAKGVVSNLTHKVLPNITLVEYADRTCSLDGILDHVRQAISLASPPAFESVALLLRRSKIGLILSETDQAVLTNESWTAARGEKQHVFFKRLAEMSLGKRTRRKRIDLLNYDSKDAESLCLAMTRLLKIPVTVSKDRFGMDKSAHRDDKESYCVGEDYFSGASLSQIVCAEVELNNSQASSQLRKADNEVVYSELVRKS